MLMINPERPKAIIYCRVAAHQNNAVALALQEAECREHAKQKEYEVVATFHEVMGGHTADRPGISSMLSFLQTHRAESHVVIVADISRLARDLLAHTEIRAAISEAGGTLESPALAFADDPTSTLFENVLASVAQYVSHVEDRLECIPHPAERHEP